MSPQARVLWVDARAAGAAGDMILAALVDLGVPLASIRQALKTLPVGGWTLSSRRIRRAALSARRVDVRIQQRERGRTWRELRRIVEDGRLGPGVRRRSLSIFRRLIEAEAEVHGQPPGKVHLHEAGGTDAIIDVVGACVALDHLAPDRIVVSPMTTGFGSVRCEHGVYPLPAPATTLLARGAPLRAGELEGERLTPTGAAILTTIVDSWGELPPMRPQAIGYGAGSRTFGDDPNLLRMVLGQHDADEGTPALRAGESLRSVTVVELNLDDATPQRLAHATAQMFEAGALDVFTTAVTMKKGRSGHLLTALVRPQQLPALSAVIFRETGTLGLRYRREERIELSRDTVKVRTPFGTVRVQAAALRGEPVRAWPEYEDCAKLARRSNVALHEVQQAALQAYQAQAEPGPGKARTAAKKARKKKRTVKARRS